ncbi:hypothetical protein GQ600_21721 [Phytophthora cactorum]|nr:hypothetical protein GQ600_21721 [Phytophthora cactorum]
MTELLEETGIIHCRRRSGGCRSRYSQTVPFGFTSSLPAVSRTLATTSPTIYNVKHVNQSLFRGYYGGCRVRTVNTTGVYIEETCDVVKHWANYGLMLQAPDDIPACTTGSDSICIHNYYNSLWEWVTGTDETPGRALMKISVFRNRYADTVALSVLPGMVMVQMMLMGIINYVNKQSVLLTQIWAYRCQNGRMQVFYLAQITYHLIYNSDLYYVGLVTGTLTVESVANLTFSFFIFSYSFINLAKARSGEQQLDRYFRLTWETMQILITTAVAALLYSIQSKSLSWIVDYNGQLLRKTTTLGKKYCGLHDSCFLMNVNLAVVVAVLSTALGLVALSASYFVQKRYGLKLSNVQSSPDKPSTKVAIQAKGVDRYIVHNSKSASLTEVKKKEEPVDAPPLTTFEEHCLGSPFTRLFKDCDDFACIQYMGKRCTSVEALLLTGYLFYGQHVYQAGSVVLLLLARLIPRKLLRTFNVLLIRWYMDPENGADSRLVLHVVRCKRRELQNIRSNSTNTKALITARVYYYGQSMATDAHHSTTANRFNVVSDLLRARTREEKTKRAVVSSDPTCFHRGLSRHLGANSRGASHDVACVYLHGLCHNWNFLIEAKDSYFAFSEMDLVMSGGCTPCHIECKKVLHQMATFHHEALMSKPTFETCTLPILGLQSYRTRRTGVSCELKASGAICSGGVDEWGSPLSIITGEAEEIVEIIETLALSVSPEQILEARKGIELKDKCVTKWAVEGHLRLFKFQAVKNSVDYSSIPAAALTSSQSTQSVDLKSLIKTCDWGRRSGACCTRFAQVVPLRLHSSIQRVSRVIATSSPTVYPAKSVTQSLFRAYYSGCRARTVNTTGIYVEDTCTLSKRWQNYGLMLQAPDDIPVCSTGTSSICIHNYYNSLWEWVTGTDGTPGRALMKISVFRNRYADTAL